MNLTLIQLKTVCPQQSAARLQLFVLPINGVLPIYGIDTPFRIQHFLAQAAHETAQFQFLTELASGTAYEGRVDLGNIIAGDGVKFKGRGIFQTTGRANYKAVSIHLFGDERLLDDPTLLSIPENAVKSAAYFWKSKNINRFADADDALGVTKTINGGTNGYQDRLKFLALAKQAIK